MTAPGGRRLRPIAVLCGLLMVLWGLGSIASLVIQLQDLDRIGWFDTDSPDEFVTWSVLFLAAAAGGAWVTMWGLFGLGWRPPLHFGAIALLVALGGEVAGMLVESGYIHDLRPRWGFGDELRAYLDGFTGQGSDLGGSDLRAFLRAAPLVTGPFVLLWWMAVLVTGAGRRTPYPQYAQPYPPQQYYAQPQPYYAQPQQYYGQPYPQPTPYPQQPYPQPYAPPAPPRPTQVYPVSPDDQPTLEFPSDR